LRGVKRVEYWRVMGASAKTFGYSAFLVACGGTPIVENLTPTSLPPSGTGSYTISANVDPNGTKVHGVQARIEGNDWPMPLNTATGTYQGTYYPSPCTVTVPFNILVSYTLGRFVSL
jgi:hypothetical protein